MTTYKSRPCPKCGQYQYRPVDAILKMGTTTLEVPEMRKFDLFGKKNSFWYEGTSEVKVEDPLSRRLLEASSEVWKTPNKPLDLTTIKTEAAKEFRKQLSQGILRTRRWGAIVIVGILILLSLMEESKITSTSFGQGTLVILLGIIILLVLLTFRVNKINRTPVDDLPLTYEQRKILNREIEAHKISKAAYEQQQKESSEAARKFFRLNYCYLCDGVFDPESNLKLTVSPENMQLLFK